MTIIPVVWEADMRRPSSRCPGLLSQFKVSWVKLLRLCLKIIYNNENQGGRDCGMGQSLI